MDESIVEINKANQQCSIIGESLGGCDDEVAMHFITQWLLTKDGEKLTKKEIDALLAEVDSCSIKGSFFSKEMVVCSVVRACHSSSEFLFYLLASGKVSVEEFEELSDLVSRTLLDMVIDALSKVNVNTGDLNAKILILHVIEKSLTSNLTQYLRTILEQDYIDSFLSSPLDVMVPLRLQIDSELNTATVLAAAIEEEKLKKIDKRKNK